MPATTAPLDRPCRRAALLGTPVRSAPVRSARAMRQRTLVLLVAVIALVVLLHPAAVPAQCYALARKSCVSLEDDGVFTSSVEHWCTWIRAILCAIGY